MLDDGTEVFDRDDDMKLVLDINLVELVDFYCDGCLKWLFEDSCM